MTDDTKATVAEPIAAAAEEPIMVVAKPFNSEYRRHRVGDPIARADLEKSRLDFDHMVDSGFIEPKAEAKKVIEPKGEK